MSLIIVTKPRLTLTLANYLEQRSESFFFFFFWLISKNDIYTKRYSMHEKHKTNPKITTKKKEKGEKT